MQFPELSTVLYCTEYEKQITVSTENTMKITDVENGYEIFPQLYICVEVLLY